MLKRIIHLAATGSIGLMIGGHAVTAGLFDKCDDERTKVSPACHPTFGYHQTCWRQFPPLPPCNSCDTCQDGNCQDGNCQIPIYQPQAMAPIPQPNPAFSPDMQSGRYHSGHSAMPGSMPPGGHEVLSSPGPFPMETSQPVMGGHSTGSRYGQGPSATGNSIPAPVSPMMQTPPAAPSNHGSPIPLPPVPSAPNHHSTGLFLPSQALAQPQTVTGNGRYGMSARRQARMPAQLVGQPVPAPIPQRGYQSQPAPRSNRYRSVGQPRPLTPNNQAAPSRVRATTTQLTQPVAAPLLKLPVR